MLNTRFGIEIEMTGITRSKAAEVIADTVDGTKHYIGTYYDTYGVTMPDGRVWKTTSDGSLKTEKKVNGRKITVLKSSARFFSTITTWKACRILSEHFARQGLL